MGIHKDIPALAERAGAESLGLHGHKGGVIGEDVEGVGDGEEDDHQADDSGGDAGDEPEHVVARLEVGEEGACFVCFEDMVSLESGEPELDDAD